MRTARMAPLTPRWTIFGPTPEYRPEGPLWDMISAAVAKKGPGFSGSIADGRGIAGSKVSASAFFCTTERQTSVQQLNAVPVAPAAKPDKTSWANLLDTSCATPLLYTSRVKKKPPVHKHCLTCMPA